MTDQRPEVVVVLRTLHRVLVTICVVGVILLAGAVAMSYWGRAEIVKSSRAACERAKLDRAAGAAGWTAHSTYITKVTGAASVKEDVKRAARAAAATYKWVSADLTKRSRIDCEHENPGASLLP